MAGKDVVIPMENEVDTGGGPVSKHHKVDTVQGLVSKHEQLLTKKRRPTEKPQFPEVSKLMPKHIQSYQDYCVPKLISFGPYHHGKGCLDRGEDLKLDFSGFYLELYLQRGDPKTKDRAGLTKELYDEIFASIDAIRQCYAKDHTDKYTDKELALMMLVDACALLYFVIYFFMDDLNEEFHNVSSEDLDLVQRDVLLLENQLPFKLLLLNLLKKWPPSFFYLWMQMFQEFVDMNNTLILPQNNGSCFPIKQIFCKKSEPVLWPLVEGSEPCHLLDLFRTNMLGDQLGRTTDNSKVDTSEGFTALPIGNVSELMAAGIRIERNQTGYLTDVSFTSYGSIAFLRLPPITIDKSTHTRFFNLIAYEMCSCDTHDFISYLRFLDSLIDHAEDVKELQLAGILHNNLGTHQEVADFFNNVSTNYEPNLVACKEVRRQISKYLRKHRQSRMRRWMTEFLDTHFSSPWSMIALIAAILVLSLTAVQTYLTIYPASSIIHRN